MSSLSRPALVSLVLSLGLVLHAAAQTELPYFDGRPAALDNNPGSSGVLGPAQMTTSDQLERGKNTFSFAVLDASVGWDGALADILAAHPGSPAAQNLAPIAVIEGNFVLTDPPLHIPVASPGKRRILRGSGGLRLGLIHDGTPETETLSLSHWGSETRPFNPHAGLLQMAESLAVDQPAKYGFLAGILPASAQDISVRTVKAIRVNDRPWLVVGCSVQTAASNYEPASGDDAYARNAQRNRLYAWNSATASWDDVSAARFYNLGSAADWEQNTWGVGVGDLNGDGTTDIVFGNYGDDFAGATNQILLGTGGGAFEFRSLASPFVANDASSDVIVADLDADGFQDIVVANRYVGWGTPSSAPDAVRSRDYVLFGRLSPQVPGVPLVQPKFSPPEYLEPYDPAHPEELLVHVRDTVALDVGDVDRDGCLDVLAGNHGNAGGPFQPDNDLEYYCPQTDLVRRHLNEDAVYLLQPSSAVPIGTPTFASPWNLPGTGGDGQLTTDILFHHIARPVDFYWDGANWSGESAGAPLQPQNGWYSMRMAENVAGADSAWRLVDIRDEWLDITRVCRTRGGTVTRLNHLINDPRYFETNPPGQHQSFAGFTDRAVAPFWSTTVPGGPPIPPVNYLYGGSFFLLHYGWGDPVGVSPSAGGFGSVGGANNPVPGGPDAPPSPAGFATLCYSNELIDFPQCLASADFVPDKRFTANYGVGSGWPSASGYPDLLIGMGYELSGVPNRLYPFTSAQLIQRVSGTEMPGVLGWGRGGSWTSGWSEKTNKGYGVGLIDAENDGDLDAIAARRSGAFLYENQGTPGTAGGKEGRFARVTDTKAWPCNDVPYAHSVLFREDSCTGDFDNDGDQDAFLVGFAGRYDFASGWARGERDEDTSGTPWLHRPGNPAHNDSMLQGTQFLLNQTIQASGGALAGSFALRSDFLDYRGRYEADQGGDRAIAADFDADGLLDMLEPRWLIHDGTSNGDQVQPGDWAALDYDAIARHRAVLFRYWHNLTPVGGAPHFADEAADMDGLPNPPSISDARVRCRTSTGVEHFGTLDARGGSDYGLGSATPLLHLRDYVGITAGDLNNDGFVDVLAAYQNHGPAGPPNGYNLFLCDSNGVLWDSTFSDFMTSWNDADVAGNTGAGSFCLAADDYDLDGDVDVFVTFSQLHEMALLENKFTSPANLPAHPYALSSNLPRAKLAARFFGQLGSGGTWIPGWMQEPLHRINNPWLLAGQHVPEGSFWSVPIDADHDGDQDLITFSGGGSAHLFWQNHVIDPQTPGAFFSDRSCDASYTGPIGCGGQPLDVADIQGEMRITAHPGAVATDLEVADLNGDSVPDLFAGYSSRHDAPYFGEWEAGSPVQANTPYVSKVFPEYGQKVGGKVRIYGTNLGGVRRVDFLFGAQASPIVLTVNQTGSITVGPAGRYLDVQLPAVVAANHKGPCGIRVVKSGVFSPVWRNTPFALIP